MNSTAQPPLGHPQGVVGASRWRGHAGVKGSMLPPLSPGGNLSPFYQILPLLKEKPEIWVFM